MTDYNNFDWLWTLISVIGSILSIFAAIKAFSAKSVSQRIAEEIRETKKKIFLRTDEETLVKLLEKAKSTSNLFSKYNAKLSLQGVDFEKDLENLMELLGVLSEDKTLLLKKTDLPLDKVYQDLMKLSSEFNIGDDLEKKDKGGKILLLIHQVTQKIKTGIDNSRRYE